MNIKKLYVMSECGGFTEYNSLKDFCDKWGVEYEKARYVVKDGVNRSAGDFVIAYSINEVVSKAERVFNLTHEEATCCVPTRDSQIKYIKEEMEHIKEVQQVLFEELERLNNKLEEMLENSYTQEIDW